MSDLIRYEIERKEKWREIANTMPFLKFPQDWEVQVIPPFVGATARFRVRVPGCKDVVSIYADHYDALGCMGEPYWEVYPYHGDTGRCLLNETDELMRMIADRRDSADQESASRE